MYGELFEEVAIMREFSKHMGSSVILHVLHTLKEAHQEQLMRFVGSQKATEQAIAWLLRMKMIQGRAPSKTEDPRVKAIYSLTPNGLKMAICLSNDVKVMMIVYHNIPEHRIK